MELPRTPRGRRRSGFTRWPGTLCKACGRPASQHKHSKKTRHLPVKQRGPRGKEVEEPWRRIVCGTRESGLVESVTSATPPESVATADDVSTPSERSAA